MRKPKAERPQEMTERATRELANTLTAIEVVAAELADIQSRSKTADPNKIKSLAAISAIARIFADKVKTGEYKPDTLPADHEGRHHLER